MLKRSIFLLLCCFFIQIEMMNFEKVDASVQTLEIVENQHEEVKPSTTFKSITPPITKSVNDVLQNIHDALNIYYAAITKSKEDGFNVPILMYHAIDEYNGSGIKDLYVTPTNFKEQMEYLKTDGFTPITFDDLPYISKYKKPIIITFDDGYKNNLNAYYILKDLHDDAWNAKAVIFMIGKKIDSRNGLSTNDIKEMSDSGIISFQSHTVTHPTLTTTTDFEKELGESKKIIEEITGKEVTAIAYPAGIYDDHVIEETEKYYKYAVTTKAGIANTASDLYEMKRVRVSYNTSLETFKQLVNQ